METRKCPICGYNNRTGASFCHRCGTTLTKPHTTSELSQQPTQPLSPPSPAKQGTRPLPGANVAFAPLPEGALLHEGLYVVQEVRAANQHLNTYLVKKTTPVWLCPNCQTEMPDLQEAFCSSCGAEISSTEPLYLRYLVQESANGRAFAAEAQLLEMHLEHPGLLLPHDIFAEAPYGPPRHYLVEPEFSPPLATSLTLPQQLNRVLEWGIGLAQALEYLHHHQVALREIGLSHITIEGKKARWTHFSEARVASPEAPPQATSYLSRDVEGLAATLFYMATRERHAPPTQLPPKAAAAFSQALTAPAQLTAADFATALEEALQELRQPANVTFVVGRRTDVGQERSLNEDSLLTLDSAAVFRSVNKPVGLFAVADGMGGHAAGDVASRLAIQAIAQRMVEEIFSLAAAGENLPNTSRWLTDTTKAANRAVHDQRRAAGTDMGTTLVMALLIDEQAVIANVGDSRAYLLKQDDLTQITTDHSLVERLVATGQITRAESIHHPQKNVIYRVIGDKARIQVDLFEQRLAPGEALLLCSDGLSGMVPDEQLWQIWQASNSPQEACDRLVEAANRAGGEDNITVVIVQVTG